MLREVTLSVDEDLALLPGPLTDEELAQLAMRWLPHERYERAAADIGDVARLREEVARLRLELAERLGQLAECRHVILCVASGDGTRGLQLVASDVLARIGEE